MALGQTALRYQKHVVAQKSEHRLDCVLTLLHMLSMRYSWQEEGHRNKVKQPKRNEAKRLCLEDGAQQH